MYTYDSYEACIATKGNLTAWRNADVKLADAECIAPDTFLSARIKHPAETTIRKGSLGSFVQGRASSGMQDGVVTATHKLQTVQFGYWMKQTAGTPTTENTPAGYNTHALTVGETVTPIDFGYHLGSTLASNNLYWDFLGILPRKRVISCSERQWEATQEIEFVYAYLQPSGDSISKTKRDENAVGTITKKWKHAVDGGLGKDQSALTYNTGDTECHIVGFKIIETRGVKTKVRDGDGFATIGKMQTHDWKVQLEIIPDGDAMFNLSRTKRADYTGALALNFDMQAHATNDKITYDFDTMYLLPFDREMDYNKYTESYLVTLEPYDEDSVFTETGIDSLNNNHYENP